MKRQKENKLTDRQRHNLRFSDERIYLLDTVHRMVEDELDRRGVCTETDSCSGVSSPQDKRDQSPECPFRNLWQCFSSLLSTRK